MQIFLIIPDSPLFLTDFCGSILFFFFYRHTSFYCALIYGASQYYMFYKQRDPPPAKKTVIHFIAILSLLGGFWNKHFLPSCSIHCIWQSQCLNKLGYFLSLLPMAAYLLMYLVILDCEFIFPWLKYMEFKWLKLRTLSFKDELYLLLLCAQEC